MLVLVCLLTFFHFLKYSVGIAETLKESIHNEDAVEEWVECDGNT